MLQTQENWHPPTHQPINTSTAFPEAPRPPGRPVAHRQPPRRASRVSGWLSEEKCTWWWVKTQKWYTGVRKDEDTFLRGFPLGSGRVLYRFWPSPAKNIVFFGSIVGFWLATVGFCCFLGLWWVAVTALKKHYFRWTETENNMTPIYSRHM